MEAFARGTAGRLRPGVSVSDVAAKLLFSVLVGRAFWR